MEEREFGAHCHQLTLIMAGAGAYVDISSPSNSVVVNLLQVTLELQRMRLLLFVAGSLPDLRPQGNDTH